jgi:Fe-S-cluster containining protein
MSEHVSALVKLIAAGRPPPTVVTAGQYRALACNRCGACCEDIPLPHPADELARLAADPTIDADRRAFAAGLELVGAAPGGWRYRCRHFRREAARLGLCTIYDTRPSVCRTFPVGETVRRWPQCSWYVQVRDEAGQVLTPVELRALIVELPFEGHATDRGGECHDQ